MNGQTSFPRGIEVLLKKAVVDPEFKDLLLARRAAAAETIGLKLDPVEAMMLETAPATQLEAVIARTRVPEEHRRVFLGQAVGTMLAALGLTVTQPGCSKGHTGDMPDRSKWAAGGARPQRLPEPEPPKSLSPEEIEKHIKQLIANRFDLWDLAMVKKETSLVKDLKATEIQLAGLKRQLETTFQIKLGGPDFFNRVQTVGDLVQAVTTAVKDRPPAEPKPEPKPFTRVAGILPDRPSHGTRPKTD